MVLLSFYISTHIYHLIILVVAKKGLTLRVPKKILLEKVTLTRTGILILLSRTELNKYFFQKCFLSLSCIMLKKWPKMLSSNVSTARFSKHVFPFSNIM